jgi:hypothetical protein
LARDTISLKVVSGNYSVKLEDEHWKEDIVETEANHVTGDADTQLDRFIMLIQKVNREYLGENATDNQKDAMEDGILYYEEDPVLTVYTLFRINNDIKLYKARNTLQNNPKESDVRNQNRIHLPRWQRRSHQTHGVDMRWRRLYN